VKGASAGEGLGNQFLGEIRQVDAVVHVVRCFPSTDVAHVFADVDPVRDLEVIETELVLADLEVLERAMAKRDKEWRTHPQDHVAERERMERYRSILEGGNPLRTEELSPNHKKELKTAGLLTGKPTLIVANATGETDAEALMARTAGLTDTQCLTLDADLEFELARMEPDEQREFMDEFGLSSLGLDRLVRESFRLLGLISFYTVVKNKLQAWEVPEGTAAVSAAGKIHTDMERGFIRAEVVAADELCEVGSLQEIRARGHLKTVGRDHEISDGDVVEFLFNV
jgi:GTP-binding protein YchF